MKRVKRVLFVALILAYIYGKNIVLALSNIKEGDMVKALCGYWSYALSSTELWHLNRNEDGYMGFNIVNVDELKRECWFCMWTLAKSHPPVVKWNGKQKVKRIGKMGINLARRMLGMVVYTHVSRCNGYHFVDYVIYGTTFGKWWNVSYQPINEDCPLHLVITADTDVMAQDFYLKDGKGRNMRWDSLELVKQHLRETKQAHP